MFEKLLTSIGIESLKIDTVLKTQQVHSNGILDGSVVIESGASEQTINQIELTLIERYDNPDERSQFPILDNELQTFTLHVDRSICKNTKEIEHFHFNIDELEFKTNPNKLILKTHAYLSHSVDAYDEDEIRLID